MIEIDGRRIDYQDQGDGARVVFVPGSFSSPSAWRGVYNALPAGYRLIGTSLCGYGRSDETRTLDDLDMHHLVRIIEAVVERAGRPVHLVGHSFGGTVALAAALAGTAGILSIATFESNPLWLLRENSEHALFDDTLRMSQAFEDAHNRGEADAAARIIDFWGQPGAFAAMPEAVQAYCRATAFTNVLDWRTAFRFAATSSAYARLAMPVLLVRGSLANPAMVHITEALAGAIPNSNPVVVDNAGHFLITSHAAECGALLAKFWATAEKPQ